VYVAGTRPCRPRDSYPPAVELVVADKGS